MTQRNTPQSLTTLSSDMRAALFGLTVLVLVLVLITVRTGAGIGFA